MVSQALFTPIRVGTTLLQHRVVLAPMTRIRANADHTPSTPMIEYYEQRASVPGTLLITEGCFIAPQASGMGNVPGIWSDAQVEGWRKIVEAVHAKGSFIYLQLWALGRAASADSLQKEAGGLFEIVSASDLAIEGGAKPRPLTLQEIQEYPALYAQAAKNFVERAGGDGVEIHSANGYLVDQFLQTNSNNRTDSYGGSVENRIRFGLEVADAIADAVGADRTGVRISPWSTFQGMRMPLSDAKETFSAYVKALKSANHDLAYIHATEGRAQGMEEILADKEEESLDFLNDLIKPTPFIVAGGFNPSSALARAESSDNTLVAFGRPFIGNPDLPARIKAGVSLTVPDRATYYIPGPENIHGYTDYPAFPPAVAA